MFLSYSQGILTSPTSLTGIPAYVSIDASGTTASLVITDVPVLAVLAHGQANYLLTHSVSHAAAWTLDSSNSSYLWFTINPATGAKGFDVTALSPIISPSAPLALVGQVWFDTVNRQTKIYRNGMWNVAIMVQVAKIVGSTITYQPTGTSSFGLNTECVAGFLLMDGTNKPIRLLDGTFLTTGTQVIQMDTTVGSSGSVVRPFTSLAPVIASEPLPKFSIIAISGSDRVSLAKSGEVAEEVRPPIGIVLSQVAQGEVTWYVRDGEVTADVWDWTAHISKSLYADEFGALTPIRPSASIVTRIAVVKDKQTLILTFDTEASSGPSTVSNTTVSGQTPISVTKTNDDYQVSIPVATTTSDGYMSSGMVTELQQKIAKAGDTMTGPLTLSGDPTLPLHAATKQYVDMLGMYTAGLGVTISPQHSIAIGQPVETSSSPTFNNISATGNVSLGGVISSTATNLTTTNDFIQTNNSGGYGGLLVARGGNPSVGIRWNESLLQWEKTSNGTTWVTLAGDVTPTIPHLYELLDVDTTSVTSPTSLQVLTWNGSKWAAAAPTASGGTANILAFSVAGSVPMDVEIMRYVVTADVGFPANFAGSLSSARAPSTAGQIWVIKRNAITIGHISWGIGATSATFTTEVGAQLLFNIGDILTVEGDASPYLDTLEDVGVTFKSL